MTSSKTELFGKFIHVKNTIKEIRDGDGPGACYMSVVPAGHYHINLVIGSQYKHACACSFCKESLEELIDLLTQIHDAME